MAAGRSDIRAGRAYVELYVKNSDFYRALSAAQQRLQNFGSALLRIGAGFTAIGGGIVGGLAGAVSSFAATGDALDKMSGRTGIAVGALAELGFAAEQSGQDMATVEVSVRKMQKTIGDAASGLATAEDALSSLGLSAAALSGMSPDEQFELIATRIAAIEDPTMRAAASMEVFGRSGTALLPMLENIQALRQEARDLGLSPSPESTKAAADITDALNRVRRVIGATIYEIGATLAPVVLNVLDAVLQVVNGFRIWITENRNLVIVALKVGAIVAGIGTAIAAVGAAVFGLGATFGAIAFAMSGFAAAGGMVVTMFSLVTSAIAVVFSPLGVLIGSLAAAGAAWLTFTQSGQAVVSFFTTRFSRIVAFVRETVGGITDALMAGDFGGAAEIALQAVQDAFAATMADLAGIWSGIQAAAAPVWNAIVSTTTSALDMVSGVMRRVFGSAWEYVESGAGRVANALAATWDRVSTGFRQAFAAVADVARQTFGGIVDALSAGDIMLAGEIAMAGLRLAVAQGLGALSGIFGETIQAITGQLLAGDITGAWSTAVASMSATWDAWSEGVVKTFTGAARVIVGAWETATNAIAALIIKQQERLRGVLSAIDNISGFAFGTPTNLADSVFGPSLADEQNRANDLQPQLDRIQRQALGVDRENLTTRIDAAVEAGDTQQVETLREQLAALDAQIAAIGTEQPDIFGDALDIARDQIGSTADAVDAALADIDRAAEARTQASTDAATAARDTATQAAADEVSRLQEELAGLQQRARTRREEAAAEREAVAANPANVPGAPEAGQQGTGTASAVTFSAAGLLALGQGTGGGVQQQTLEEIRAQRLAAEESRQSLAKWVRQGEQLLNKLDRLGLHHP